VLHTVCINIVPCNYARMTVTTLRGMRTSTSSRPINQRRQALRSPGEIPEQIAEARVAHGSGAELVNIFTGERFRT